MLASPTDPTTKEEEIDPELRLRKYADVLLDVGLELRPGRTLAIDAHLEHAPLVRMVAAGAYARVRGTSTSGTGIRS